MHSSYCLKVLIKVQPNGRHFPPSATKLEDREDIVQEKGDDFLVIPSARIYSLPATVREIPPLEARAMKFDVLRMP